MLPKKGQVSVEFMGVMTVMFLMFMVFTAVILGQVSEYRNERHWTALKDMASIIETEIKTAAAMENGFERTFFLPNRIDEKEYSVTVFAGDGTNVNKTAFQVQYVNFSVDVPYTVTVPLKTNGTIVTGMNTIRKVNDWVCINSATCP